MPPISVLIKPSSSACNMSCRYCFYKDEAKNRATEFNGMLSLSAAEKIIASASEFADGFCSFMFQGGEPTLRGLPFFKSFIEIEKKYKKDNLVFSHSIQTNGLLIDDEWAEFFSENKFLVGLSLDGPAAVNDLNRCDNEGKGTYNRVIKCAALLEKHKTEYNILSVVTGKNARNAAKIYNTFKKCGFSWLQFIPCLEPIEADGKSPFFLSADDYKSFLITVFNLWFEDLKRGTYISVRHIDNIMSIVLGGKPEICSMNGKCSIQFVVEGDGGVYPCDFYVLDEWKLGNVFTESFSEIAMSKKAAEFIKTSVEVPEECKICKYYMLCRNGCRRERVFNECGVGKNRYCESIKGFYDECAPKINEAARIIRQMRMR